MAENENVLKPEETEVLEEQVAEVNEAPAEENAAPAPKPSKGNKAKAAVKEWFRKKIVGLKRKPQTIALIVLAITTIFFMLSLFVLSKSIYEVNAEDPNTTIGLCIFVTTLLSLLVLVSFLNSFPKRKKPNIFFIVLVFLMIGAMLACDIVYYVQMQGLNQRLLDKGAAAMAAATQVGQPYILAHIVLLGVSAIVFALLPAYKILINKINTTVELESAPENMHGDIDIEED